MKEYKFTVSYDWNPYDVVAELNNITSKYGITMDFDEEEHDGFDICIVKISDKLDPSYSPPGAFKNHPIPPPSQYIKEGDDPVDRPKIRTIPEW